ncbi:dihydroneopterin aldolase [Riemerella columbipharyngis]|uniref:7,8-dihydroneopterin aldolase n=1 Tax=Riemerella columbipharyngis TaxID=1071918 RepID=A0A1G7BS97_9FLAO|nr:dihydroneopterin aldolase [Riemerella columbipharyngis]SDE29520.1 dihydroneopterin aldolase [Riemerella columbipharyngis]
MSNKKNLPVPDFGIIDEFKEPDYKDLPKLIQELKKEKGFTILAESFLPEEVLNVADYVDGELVDRVAEIKSPNILYCGENIQAEVIKDEYEDKNVFVPEIPLEDADKPLKEIYYTMKYEFPEIDDIHEEMNTAKIILEDVKIYAYHGVLEEERKMGTYYLVTVEIEADIWRATRTDEIEETISYAEVNDIIHREMAIPSKLLERVAGRIINKLHNAFEYIESISVKITKCNPPMKGEMKGASVQLKKYFY